MARTVVSFTDLLDFTRASAKWTWNASGALASNTTDVPGFTYQPATLATEGLWLEGAGTNLAETPTAPHSVMTAAQGTITANNAAAPDGTTTMALFTVNSSTTVHYTYKLNWSITTSGTLATYSVYLKHNGIEKIRVRVYDHVATANGIYADFDLANGTVLASAAIGTGSVVGAKIERYASGACRIWLTGTAAVGAANNIQLRLVCLNSAGTGENFAGDGTSGFWFWGVNVIASPLAQSFISTAGARAADICQLETLTPWFTSSAHQGTFLAKYLMTNLAPSGIKLQLFRLDDGTDDNVIEAYVPAGTGDIETRIRAGASTVFNEVAGSFTAGSVVTLGITFIANGFAASVNGGIALTAALGAVPTGISAGYLGCSDATGANSLWNKLKRFEFYPVKLSADDLRNLTA